MKVDDLKPCPFCGAPHPYITIEHGYLDESAIVFCNACKISVKLEENDQEGFNAETKRKAIEAWNRRTKDEMADIVTPIVGGQPTITPPQKEPLTYIEQSIFLAAMGREEKVCKEVDAEMTREPFENNLVRVCREIKRKVKKVLWTK